jgi:hypothetical protein
MVLCTQSVIFEGFSVFLKYLFRDKTVSIITKFAFPFLPVGWLLIIPLSLNLNSRLRSTTLRPLFFFLFSGTPRRSHLSM